MSEYLYVFLCSMLPLVELRGSIPMGAAFGLGWVGVFIVSVLGNLLPVPFILLFIKKILELMKRFKRLAPIALWVEEKARRGSDKVLKYATWGLFLFVAIPLPGTGAWTGALIAALLGMKPRYAVLSIAAGVLTAGVIVTCIAYGVLGFLSFLL